jgi:hypothetical protein
MHAKFPGISVPSDPEPTIHFVDARSADDVIVGV